MVPLGRPRYTGFHAFSTSPFEYLKDMLCRQCERSIQVAAKTLDLYPQRMPSTEGPYFARYNSLWSFPLHESLGSLYESILAGCFICRQLWQKLLRRQRPGRDSCFAPPSLADLAVVFGELTGGTGHVNIVTKWACRILGLVTSYAMQPCYVYTGNSRLLEGIEKSREWCKRRSPIWLRIGQSEGFLYIFVHLAGSARDPIAEFSLVPAPFGVPSAPSGLGARHASTGDMAGLWRHWFSTCIETHADCRAIEERQQPFTPTRLVQLFLGAQGNVSAWALICPAADSKIPYLTLSHCWGLSLPLRLTRANYPTMLEPAPVSRLPQTYQHAVTIAHSLGFRHIWIDSLCIFQDDENDWETQSSLMGLIYGRATCNIAASSAWDGEGGCFNISDPARRIPTSISLGYALEGSTEYQISDLWGYNDDITDAPLNRRGWVVQERYLARRQLSFTARQVYWECHEFMASEQHPFGVPRALWSPFSLEVFGYNATRPLTAKPHLRFQKEVDIRRSWAALVNLYSSCQFTRISDKLVALSGLVKEMERATGDVYLSGLWKKDLYQQLCWTFDGFSGPGENRTTIPRGISPTWSWANLDGPVVCSMAYFKKACQPIPLMEVLETSGGLTRRLTLRGIAVRGNIGEDEQVEDGQQDNSLLTLPSTKVMLAEKITSPGLAMLLHLDLHIHWDENIASADMNPDGWSTLRKERGSTLLFFMVLRDHSCGNIQGLVLRQLPVSTAEPVLHVRMGSFEMKDLMIESFLGHISSRNGMPQPNIDYNLKSLDLGGSRLLDMVHTVHVI